jgi:iduronate 2-sulfatase
MNNFLPASSWWWRGAFVLLSTVTLQAASARRPNILFLAADDLKPLMGCYGDTRVKTPHLDRLGAAGTVFLNNHSQQAVCGPTRASLLLGLRPDTTKVWDLATKMRDINPDVLTLPQHFKAHGWFTVAMGKIFDGRCVDGPGKQDAVSWSKPYIGTGSGRYATIGMKDGVPLPTHTAAMTRPSTESADVPDEVYQDGRISARAIEELRTLAKINQPFFLAVGFLKPHLPFTAPKRFWDLYRREDFRPAALRALPAGSPVFAGHESTEIRNAYSDIPAAGPFADEKQLELIHGYYATVSFVDAQVGKVLAELRALGLEDNTIVVLWGDHGFHLGDHGLWCKHTNYEQATRAPLLIRAPGIAGGARPNSPTEFVDVFPTLCDLAGLPVPKHLHGVSLRPLMTQTATAVKEVAISQYPRVVEGKPVMGYAYRSSRHRYVRWIEKNYRAGETTGRVLATELFDYETDPDETVNLAARPEHAATLAWFEQAIARARY